MHMVRAEASTRACWQKGLEEGRKRNRGEACHSQHTQVHFKLSRLRVRHPMRLSPALYLVPVTMSATNHEAHDAFLALSRRDHCASFVIVVTLNYEAVLAVLYVCPN